MNGMPNESERMLSNDQTELPLVDEDISEGSLNAGNQVLKKGPWTTAEDAVLVDYVKKYGEGNWNAVQKHTGLSRCGKSCRLRWANHLRPNLKKGAFTPEEEQLIIDLHAKMGNKWARMAAYLPGRTDNEIKNYWNTRIKRRQRAGLPLYPPNICFKVCDENQQRMNASDYSYGDKLPTELLGNNLDIPAIIFDNFDDNHGALSFAPPFQDIAVGNMLDHSLGSHNNAFTNPTNCIKQLRGSENLIFGIHGTIYGKLPTHEHVLFEPPGKVQWHSVLSYPYDPDPSSKNLTPLGGSIPGSHSNLNGTFSASSPACGTMKLELPSLQYNETDGDSWFACPSTPVEAVDAHVESPPTTVSLQSECMSPCKSGLLEALVNEAQTLGNERKRASKKITSSLDFTPNDMAESSGVSIFEKLEEHNDPISPFGQSASSVLSEHTHPISGSSSDEFLRTISSSSKSRSLCRDCSRPDALLGSVWLEDGSQSANDNSIFNESVAILLGRDFCKYKPLPSETSSMLMQGFGLDFEPWDNMPHTCQMP